ncbi:MAG: hypothetical protein Q8O67_18570 [Deltaproteobacteria bacterium]|nr:hypothetical protein [Deltaproteobacteria bacterium]
MTVTPRTRVELAEMLSKNLGMTRAIAAVDVAADALGVGAEMGNLEALEVLSKVADQPGLVGIAARFAKSRAHLKWS